MVTELILNHFYLDKLSNQKVRFQSFAESILQVVIKKPELNF